MATPGALGDSSISRVEFPWRLHGNAVSCDESSPVHLDDSSISINFIDSLNQSIYQSESPDSPGRGRMRRVSHVSVLSVGSLWGEELGPLYSLRSKSEVDVTNYDNTTLEQQFVTLQVIGQGNFGTVREVVCRKTGKHFALKTVVKDLDSPTEIAIALQLSHPSIVSMHGVISDETHFYIILDLCCGESLKTYMMLRREPLGFGLDLYHHPPSRKVGIFSKQILQALAYLHHYKIAHRDVKPDNCLLQTPGKTTLKLADFGLATKFQKGVLMERPCWQHTVYGTRDGQRWL
ncbi:unnamed protein product [Polarella glacialis]|uniref:Protein kinase domain-containing protein n=1 Tax=Polarella glacialis TaxID=89957 RepID=A0A813JMG1_POLGL|nr:unnamed protein product [Polarella glacialis]